MARNRNKTYQQGDRINIYLSREITPEFIEWINKQSDLSNFFLYAAQQLYQKTGFVDVSEIMPRKINFNLSSNIKTDEVKPKANKSHDKETEENLPEDEKTIEENNTWSNLGNLDDDYA